MLDYKFDKSSLINGHFLFLFSSAAVKKNLVSAPKRPRQEKFNEPACTHKSSRELLVVIDHCATLARSLAFSLPLFRPQAMRCRWPKSSCQRYEFKSRLHRRLVSTLHTKKDQEPYCW